MERLKLLASFARGRILDVGFGKLPNKYLQGERVIGVDKRMCATTPNYDEVFVKDIEDGLIGDYVVDTIVAGEIFEHLLSPYDFLMYCYIGLAWDGVLVMSTPNSSSAQIVLANTIGWRMPKEHTIEYSKRSVIRMAEKVGFTKRKTIGLTSLFWWSKRWRHRFFVRIPMWLLPLAHILVYVFDKEME
jgi:2-polyprenyl-3-methyl-5-hydroxy-6-metoxy-1,4-benzoquinol methylase